MEMSIPGFKSRHISNIESKVSLSSDDEAFGNQVDRTTV